MRNTANTVNLSDRRVLSRIGRFEIKKELGRGALGTVYLAIDPQLDRPVALKVPHFGVNEQPKSITRFLREAKAAAGLHHPNIVAVHDAGRHDENFYIASAFVDGSSLREKMKADGMNLFEKALNLDRQSPRVCRIALDALVVHNRAIDRPRAPRQSHKKCRTYRRTSHVDHCL